MLLLFYMPAPPPLQQDDAVLVLYVGVGRKEGAAAEQAPWLVVCPP